MNRGRALETLNYPLGYRLQLSFLKGKALKRKKVRLRLLTMVRGGRSGACYVHMAANASFTNSHQMMDSDKMGMNDHIEVSKISLMSFIHILELMKFAKSGRNAQRHFCLFIFSHKRLSPLDRSRFLALSFL